MAWNKRTAIALFVGMPLTLIAAFLMWYTGRPEYRGLHPISLAGQTIYVTVADTDSLRALGLGGRPGLASGEGMLFIFPTPGVYRFWMKDMEFSIDMIWLDKDGTIVFIAPNVSPDTFPETFGPDIQVLYVLELSAGYAAAHGIQVGGKMVM